jgi:hypothetical protein
MIRQIESLIKILRFGRNFWRPETEWLNDHHSPYFWTVAREGSSAMPSVGSQVGRGFRSTSSDVQL